MLSRMLSVLIAGCFRKIESTTAISDWKSYVMDLIYLDAGRDEELG
jgi:hypothetical protein